MKMLRKLFRRLQALRRDERGAMGPAIAVLSISLIAAAGLALDVGLYYMGNRDLRSATEAAALSAAMRPAHARGRAAEFLAKNGYPHSVLKSVEVGYYCANVATKYPAGQRFVTGGAVLAECPGSTKQNAVRLTTEKESRRFLTGILGGAGPIPNLTATASAARIDEAGIAVASDLLRLTSGGVTDAVVNLVNTLLYGLLGVQLNLSAPDITALMSNNVDAGLFFDALAKRKGVTGTYSDLVAGTYSMNDIALAAADAAQATGKSATVATLTRIAPLMSGKQVSLKNLFGLGVWKNMKVGGADVKPALRAGLNPYQLILFSAQAGASGLNLSGLTGLALPGSTVKLVAVANGPMAQPRFSFGPAGETRVSTSQLRIKLDVGIPKIAVSLPLLNLLNLEVKQLPLLLDIAPASATITDITCSTDQANDTSVRVAGKSALLSAYIADVPESQVTKDMTEVVPTGPAQLLNTEVGLGALKILSIKATANAKVTPVTGAEQPVVFGPGGNGTISTPDAPGTAGSIRNRAQVTNTISNLTADLSRNIDVRVSLLNNLLSISTAEVTRIVLGGLLDGITTALLNLTGNVVDPLLDNLLAALGVQLGDATIWVTGARCGVPVLI